jgi:hypothetical protein
MSNFKVSQLPASTELVVEDILPVVDVSQMLTKKAEVGDLIDLASTTIESMPNLIVDPENNFTNFSQAVRNELTGGDGITYTAATGEVKLKNKSITINSTVVNLGDSISIPSGPTYTQGTGISLAGNVITNTAPGVIYTQGTGINIAGTTISNAGVISITNSNTNATDISNTGGNYNVGVKTTPSFTNVTITNSIASTSAALTITQPDDPGLGTDPPAVTILNYGNGNSFEVLDSVSDTTNFIINHNGNVSIGTPIGGDEAKLTVHGKVAYSGSYANKSNIFTQDSLTTYVMVNSDTNNYFIVSGVTGSVFILPDLSFTTTMGTEFIFRKMQSAPRMIVAATGSGIFDLQITYPGLLRNYMDFNTTDEVFLKVRAVMHPGLLAGPFPMWSVVYLNTIKSTTYQSYFPPVSGGFGLGGGGFIAGPPVGP